MEILLLIRYHQTRLDKRSVPRLFTPFKGALEHTPVLEAQSNRPRHDLDKDAVQ